MGRIGFIGLGLLGQAMALRLVREGFDLVVWNREPTRMAPLASAGAQTVTSPQAVAESCEVVCLCVLHGGAVRDVMFGPQGVVAGSRKPSVVIDFSTVTPPETHAIADEAASHGVHWIDAPVSGGPIGAAEGSLAIMAGGRESDIARTRPVFEVLAGSFTHVGDVGSGQQMKVVNQALVGSMVVMLAETFTLARHLGLNLEAVPQSLKGGLVDSVALQRIWPLMIENTFEPPMGLASQMLKDLDSVNAEREKCALTLPLVEQAIAQFRTYVHDQDAGAMDTFSIRRLYDAQEP